MKKIRFATEDDIEIISKIANKNTKELGFVMKVALKESILRNFLKVCEYNDKIVGFVNFRKRKDGITIIYELCVLKEFRGKGLGKMLIDSLPTPIILKCPVDNLSNKFYSKIGFNLIEVQNGRKRKLNVWLKKDENDEIKIMKQVSLFEEE